MAKIYETKKKRIKPHAFHWFDFVALAALVWLITQAMPVGIVIDLSAGFNEPSQAYLEVDAERNTELIKYVDTNSRYFEEIFTSSGVQYDSRVFPRGNGTYFVYMNDSEGWKYYPVINNKLGDSVVPDIKGDIEPGYVKTDTYMTIDEDGRVSFADEDGYYGPTNVYIDLVSKPDYALAYEKLTPANPDVISAEDSVYLYSLIERDILIGFQDKVAWFHEAENGTHSVYRADANGVTRVWSEEGEITNIFAAANRFIIYQKNGDLHFYDLAIQHGSYFGINEFEDFGTLRNIAYCVRDNGDVLICGYADHAMFYYLLSVTDGSCYKQIKMQHPGREIKGIFATNYGDCVIWLDMGEEYLRYTID